MTTRTFWQKYKLPLMILVAFTFAAIWVGVGRLLFGVFGWMAFITLFMFAPIIFLYGIVLAIIVGVRQRSYGYRKRGPFMIWMLVTLAALFCVGFFMPDAGDIPESVSSPLSVLLMDRNNEALIGISGGIAGWAIFVTVVASIVTFVMAFVERQKKTKAASSLKQAE
jgi:hypothetical protein